jgi:sterol desaturase/sphingolipid hydroxylase (fatty acid hydroxylase superfamily)
MGPTSDLAVSAFMIIVAAMTMIMIAERINPYQKGQPVFRKGYFVDFFWYTLVQSYILGLVIFAVINWIDRHTSIERISLIRDLPIWVQVILFLVAHDFFIYWFHRLQHRSAILWRTHEAHHSNTEVDWLSGSRSHALEIMILQTVEFMPIVLFASPEVAVIKSAVDAIWGMYIHSNINVRSGRLQYLINGPEMHRWHHAVDADAHNKNFSTKLAIWDWMFKTAYRPQDRKPSGYGLGQPFPETYFAQHAYAFRRSNDGDGGA